MVYTVYEVYYPDDWYIQKVFNTLEEALDYKTELQNNSKSNVIMFDYVVVISDP